MFKSFGFLEALSRGANWLCYALLSLWFEPNEFGQFSLMLAFILMASGFGVLGQDRFVLRYTKPDSDLTSSLFWSPLLIVFVISLGIPGLLLVLNNHFQLIAIPSQNTSVLLLWCTLQAIYLVSVAWVRALHLPREFLVLRTGYTWVKLVVFISLGFSGAPLTAFVCTEAALLAMFLGGNFVFLRKRISAPSFSQPTLSTAFRYGSPFLLHMAATLSMAHLDKLMIGAMATAREVGIYAFLNTVASGVFFLTAVTNVTFESKVYRTDSQAAAESILHKMLVINLSGCLVLLAAINIGLSPILTFLQRQDYYDATVLGVLSIGYLIYPCYIQGNIRLNLREKVSRIPIMSGVACVVNIGGNLLLIPLYGILGAAMSTFGGYVVLVALAAWMSRKE